MRSALGDPVHITNPALAKAYEKSLMCNTGISSYAREFLIIIIPEMRDEIMMKAIMSLDGADVEGICVLFRVGIGIAMTMGGTRQPVDSNYYLGILVAALEGEDRYGNMPFQTPLQEQSEGRDAAWSKAVKKRDGKLCIVQGVKRRKDACHFHPNCAISNGKCSPYWAIIAGLLGMDVMSIVKGECVVGNPPRQSPANGWSMDVGIHRSWDDGDCLAEYLSGN